MILILARWFWYINQQHHNFHGHFSGRAQATATNIYTAFLEEKLKLWQFRSYQEFKSETDCQVPTHWQKFGNKLNKCNCEISQIHPCWHEVQNQSYLSITRSHSLNFFKDSYNICTHVQNFHWAEQYIHTCQFGRDLHFHGCHEMTK